MTTMHASTCVVCAKRPPEWSLTCAPCRNRMRDQLAELVEEYALLDATPGSSTGQRVSGTREAPLPVRVDVLNLVGPGSPVVRAEIDPATGRPYDDQVGELPTLVWLEQWCRYWRDLRGQGEQLPEATITGMTRWLDRRLDWAADEHESVVDFAAELGKALRLLRGVNRAGDRPESMFIGYCPADAADGPCGAPLYANTRYAVITCGCGAEWRRGDGWDQLAAAMEETGTDGRGAA